MLNFGVGQLQMSATGGVFTLGRLQNISITVSYENAQLRGGTEVFATDTQFFNGAVEGSFEHADIDLSEVARLMAGSGSFAGAAGSGTFTLSGTFTTRRRFAMIFSGVTNGFTGTIKLEKVFIRNMVLDFARTEYMIPTMDFVCETETGGNVLTWVA